MSKKTKDLGEKIKAAKQERADSPENMKNENPQTTEDVSYGMRMVTELFAGVLVGTIIGYFFDDIFDTLPIFLIIFIILGAAAGFWNVYKAILKDSAGN